MPDTRITRPCEFPRCDDSTEYIEVRPFGDYAWFVVCGRCGAFSFWADTQEEAIAIWNHGCGQEAIDEIWNQEEVEEDA
jgi:hypothetical protein